MDDDVCPFGRFGDLIRIAHIPDDEPECVVPELTLQPVNVARRACTGQIVKDGDMFPTLNQPVDIV
jgi:hypothetical protein